MTNSGEEVSHQRRLMRCVGHRGSWSCRDMDAQLTSFQSELNQSQGRTAARHLSRIQEESDSREHSTCFLPPIVQQQQAARAAKPDRLVLYEQQRKLQDDRSLLEELGRIEAELCLDVERRQETESFHQKKNKQQLQNLLHLSLSQRVTNDDFGFFNRPWVSSYFRVFPMHIYCLPVQTVRHKGRRPGPNKRR